MNREILFRGKQTDDGEWAYGYYFYDNFQDKAFITFGNNCFKIGNYCMSLDRECPNKRILSAFEVIPETVGQYTGLTDKNDTKIFEGDILKCHDNQKDLIKVVFCEFGVVDTDTECPVDTVIGWHYEVIPTDELSTVEPFCLSMPLTKSYIKYCHMEVIGNIHDNPELLEQED